MADLLERLPENFEMITMQLRAKPLLAGEAGPFVVVALQVLLILLKFYMPTMGYVHSVCSPVDGFT